MYSISLAKASIHALHFIKFAVAHWLHRTLFITFLKLDFFPLHIIGRVSGFLCILQWTKYDKLRVHTQFIGSCIHHHLYFITLIIKLSRDPFHFCGVISSMFAGKKHICFHHEFHTLQCHCYVGVTNFITILCFIFRKVFVSFGKHEKMPEKPVELTPTRIYWHSQKLYWSYSIRLGDKRYEGGSTMCQHTPWLLTLVISPLVSSITFNTSTRSALTF